MKKILLAAVALSAALTFTGCNSCTHVMKDLESDFSELERFAKANGLPEIKWEEENDA